MKFMTFDLETQNHKSFRRTANPFDERNWVVAYGWSINFDQPQGLYYPEHTAASDSDFVIPDDVDVLVGQNIKFDLSWVWNTPTMINFLKRGGRVWDTQLAEYYLEAQSEKSQMVSLDTLAAKYDGTQKIDEVKALWNEGVLTADIPEELLMEYLLEGDIPNTRQVFLQQVKRAASMGMKKLIMTRMQCLLFTTECEYNGLYVDIDLGRTQAQGITAALHTTKQKLHDKLPAMPKELLDKWAWTRHSKSAVLFGGALKYKKWTPHLDENDNPLYASKDERWPLFDKAPVSPTKCTVRDGFYYLLSNTGDTTISQMQDVNKTGKHKGEGKFKNVKVPDTARPKGAQVEYLHKFPRLLKPKSKWKGRETFGDGSPIYQTGGDQLIELSMQITDEGSLPALLASEAKMTKDLRTYYISEDGTKGMLTCVGNDNIIHHSIHNNTTKTTRQSSTDPNCQNLPRKDKSDVKRMFKSRFEGGRVTEIDYSQLEVVIQAWLTGDAQMIKDVNDRVDFHCKRLALKLGETYEHVLHKVKVEEDVYYVDLRIGAKKISFQMAYGAGAEAIAEDLGLPLDDVKAIIEAEFVLYPSIAKFYDNIRDVVEADSQLPHNVRREEHPLIPNKWRSYRVGAWSGPTGTMYRWRQWDAPDWLQKRGTLMTFSPPERKNWPAQGTGGETMQLAQAMMFRVFVENGWWSGGEHNVLLTNTVHDCLWTDMEGSYVKQVLQVQHDIMTNVDKFFEHAYGITVPVTFSAEAEVGTNMYAMETHHVSPDCSINIKALCDQYL